MSLYILTQTAKRKIPHYILITNIPFLYPLNLGAAQSYS